MANPPITGRSTSKLGTPLIRQAKELAAQAQRVGMNTKYQLINGFLLRGVKLGKRYAGQVVDLPGGLLFKGNSTQLAHTDSCPSGPSRDQVSAGKPAEDSTRSIVGATPPWLPMPPPKVTQAGTQRAEVVCSHEWQGSMFSHGRMLLPYNLVTADAYWQDSFAAFPASMVVAITVQFAAYRLLAIASDATSRRVNVFSLSAFSLAESDLPAGWSMFPRRLVDEHSYALNDAFRDVNYYEEQQFGFSWKQAADLYHYCVARDICQQDQALFQNSSGGSTYYDRFGQHALGVFLASLDPSTYNAASPEQLYAALDSQFMITTDLLPAYLHPGPGNINDVNPDTGMGHTVPMYGRFRQPRVLRTTNGFTVFANYRTYVGAQLPTTINPDVLVNTNGIVVVAPDKTVTVLKADSRATDTIDPATLPGYDERYVTWPWIIGGFSVDTTDAQGNVTTTAWCLVWEQWDARYAENQDPAYLDFNGTQSNIAGGAWALYSHESGDPVRRVLTEADASASPVAALLNGTFMTRWPAMFSPTNLLRLGAETEDIACFHDAGGGFAVTPVIDKPFPLAAISGSGQIPDDLKPHDLKCGWVDLANGTIQTRGTITQRTNKTEKVYISVAQPYVPADTTTGAEAIEATLIATVYYLGAATAGETWLSVDGGYTWTVYIADAGAPVGAYYMGSNFYEYDPLKLFSAF